jgi:hypothetical protein
MKVKLIAIICNEDQLKNYFDVVLGSGKTIKEIYNFEEDYWNFPCIIYENDKNQKWIADEGDYFWGLMDDKEQIEFKKEENQND